ncbi:MAG: hypothetical protein AAF840_05000, partial [Bacteroidota bacterium]
SFKAIVCNDSILLDEPLLSKRKDDVFSNIKVALIEKGVWKKSYPTSRVIANSAFAGLEVTHEASKVGDVNKKYMYVLLELSPDRLKIRDQTVRVINGEEINYGEHIFIKE